MKNILFYIHNVGFYKYTIKKSTLQDKVVRLFIYWKIPIFHLMENSHYSFIEKITLFMKNSHYSFIGKFTIFISWKISIIHLLENTHY